MRNFNRMSTSLLRKYLAIWERDLKQAILPLEGCTNQRQRDAQQRNIDFHTLVINDIKSVLASR
jgi:hypothetical protein